MWIETAKETPRIGQRVVTDGFLFATWDGEEWKLDSGEKKSRYTYRLWMEKPNSKPKQVELDDVPF